MPFMAGAMIGMVGLNAIGGWSASRRSAREMRRMRQLMERQLKFAQEQWQHYRDTYGDLEQVMVADAMQGVQGDYAGVVGRAAADVEGQFANQRDRQQRDMMRMGLDPSSGRYQSSDRAMGLQQATTSAMAQNQARDAERRYAQDATWQRRQSVGMFGAGMMNNAGQNVQQAMGQMGQMHQQNAQHYGNMSNNLFMQAGQMGMYGLMQLPSMQGTPQSQPQAQMPAFQPQGMQFNTQHGFNQPDPWAGTAWGSYVSPAGGMQMPAYSGYSSW